MQAENEFDVIVIGSGTCGATIARELSKQNKKVLILERGGDAPLKESLMGFAAISDQVTVGKKLTTVRAITTGGSTGLYFGVVNYPPLDAFAALGVDISAELEEVRRELPIAPLPDDLLGEQAIKLRESATALGHSWHKHDMLIDQSKCSSGYSHAALWRARRYVEDAVRQGATLINRATVHKVLVDKGQAIGVKYRLRKNMFVSELRCAYGTKIVLAAGELASPKILRDSGVEGIANRGFYCNPGYAIYGLIPGMKARETFVGSMGCAYDDGIELGDANIPQFLHRPMMLSKLKIKQMSSYPESIGIGVKVKDSFGGELKADGSFHKDFTQDDYAKLRNGEEEARRILKKAGARDIFNFGISCAGRVGGLISIQEHLDTNLETQYRNLHVCDGSVIPEAMRGTPTLTLLSLAKYLAKHLTSLPVRSQ
jgi:choline dehydrogenase-like flavoprotein